jgi:VCBS repeat-containing protein
VTLTSAESINDSGEIVGRAMTTVGQRAFLLRPMIPPAPPIAAAATTQANAIALNWQDRSHNEWGFEIQRRVGIDPATAGPEDGWSPLITVGPNVVTFTDSSLLPGTNYQYRIRAFNDNGSSGYQVSQAVQTRQNRLPIATADSYSMTEDKVLTIPAAKGLLINDRDPDGDALVVAQIRSGPEHGQLQWSADGSFTYTPEHNYAGSDRFEYVLRDAAGGQSSATVTLKSATSRIARTLIMIPIAPSRTRSSASSHPAC